MIAALFVQTNGAYFGVPGVDPWDEIRDARKYPGPYPVVAHPPCARWSVLAPAAAACWGWTPGDDGGCFASALDSVRKWGGVLEHPARSAAWSAHDLPHPPKGGGWHLDTHGGWCCWVDQAHYGHPISKPTWLYYVGSNPPPVLALGRCREAVARMVAAGITVATYGNKQSRSRTPPAFKEILLSMARSARREAA